MVRRADIKHGALFAVCDLVGAVEHADCRAGAPCKVMLQWIFAKRRVGGAACLIEATAGQSIYLFYLFYFCPFFFGTVRRAWGCAAQSSPGTHGVSEAESGLRGGMMEAGLDYFAW